MGTRRKHTVRLTIPADNVQLSMFVEGLRYAGIVTPVASTTPITEIDLFAPRGQDFDVWAEQVIPHFKSLGFNAYEVIE